MMNSSSPMAGWALNNQKLLNSKALDHGNEMVMGPGVDFMQNCDLPPPMKVFAGSDKTVLSSMNRVFSMTGKEDEDEDDDNNGEFNVYRKGGDENEKLELLKALRLSQTRAREAEKKAARLVKERDCVSNAFLEEATRLFAYRQWVRLLELQVSKLQSQWLQQQHKQTCCSDGDGDNSEDGGGVTWFVALAFCLGFVGVGFAFGYRYLF